MMATAFGIYNTLARYPVHLLSEVRPRQVR